jgi:hypothetical protein
MSAVAFRRMLTRLGPAAKMPTNCRNCLHS